MTAWLKTALAAAAAVAGASAVAGTVEVTYVAPERFSDIGWSNTAQRDNLDHLKQVLQGLGSRYVPDGQTMRIEVTDVDVAGDERPTTQGDVRVSRGMADVPRISFRYTLVSGGSEVDRGEVALSDLDYARRMVDTRASESLAYERRMLDRWFRQRFASAQ
jgi:hypothetical protein